MEWYIILALVGTGIAAGFINTTAGGGSMLTLPLLMILGLVLLLLMYRIWPQYCKKKSLVFHQS